MQIHVIKPLVETYSLEELASADAALAEGLEPEIDVPGNDEGEKLTHVYAAMWIKERMEKGDGFRKALRAYTQKVRKSVD